jgi:dynein heavy chain
MQKMTLHALPEDKPWSIDEFMEKTEEACRIAAIDLHRKSLMVEEAVEEVLELVKNATSSFKGAQDSDQFDLLDGKIHWILRK